MNTFHERNHRVESTHSNGCSGKSKTVSAPCETLTFDDPSLANMLFGPQNTHLRHLSAKTGAELSSCGASLGITTQNAALQERLLNLFTQFYGIVRAGQNVSIQELEQGLQLLEDDESTDLRQVFRRSSSIALPRKTLIARNASQRAYLDLLRGEEMVFATGPAGTGKTYLAVGVALSMLLARRVRRIVLTRPAVEAGERLGFLPGDLAEKVNPYLRPLYDALQDMLGQQKLAMLQEAGNIEVAPLAFMRGRTLNDAFIILDEAQNTTREQMKMFLTRLGFGSRAVITGDVTQIDLPPSREASGAGRSGLLHAKAVLSRVKGVSFHTFTTEDVVRHPLVGRIVQAYDLHEKQSAESDRAL